MIKFLYFFLLIILAFSSFAIPTSTLKFKKEFRISGGLNMVYYFPDERFKKAQEYMVAKWNSPYRNVVTYRVHNTQGYQLTLTAFPLVYQFKKFKIEAEAGIEVFNYKSSESLINQNNYKNTIIENYFVSNTDLCNSFALNVRYFDFILQAKTIFSHINYVNYKISFTDNTSFSLRYNRRFAYYTPYNFYFFSIGYHFKYKYLPPFTFLFGHEVFYWPYYKVASFNLVVYI